MAVLEIMPTANQLTKLGKMQSASCWLCRRSQKPEVRALTIWRLKHTVTSIDQVAKGWH